MENNIKNLSYSKAEQKLMADLAKLRGTLHTMMLNVDEVPSNGSDMAISRSLARHHRNGPHFCLHNTPIVYRGADSCKKAMDKVRKAVRKALGYTYP